MNVGGGISIVLWYILCVGTDPHTYTGSQLLIEQMRPLSLVNNSMHEEQMKLGYKVYYLGYNGFIYSKYTARLHNRITHKLLY